MIPKKSQQGVTVVPKTRQPSTPFKIGKKEKRQTTEEPNEVDPVPEQTVSATTEQLKKRLSVDIYEQAHYLIKCHATANRTSVGSILNDLIYKHCTSKITA